MNLRVVIADDGRRARQRLRRFRFQDPDLKIEAECSGGPEAVGLAMPRGHFAFPSCFAVLLRRGASANDGRIGGGKGIRTPGLLIANETLYQLSYTPIYL
jgi:hypothetical protein